MKTFRVSAVVSLFLLQAISLAQAEQVADFQNITVGLDGTYTAPTFTSGGAQFDGLTLSGPGANPYGDGFTVSNHTDLTDYGDAAFLHPHNAIPGQGSGGSTQYAIAYASTAATVSLGANTNPVSIDITNNTYAYYSMHNGDSFAKKFGGDSGNDPDWFKLTITGYDAANAAIGTVPVFLADFTSADNSQDYILSQWKTVDLSSLAGAATLGFSLTSTDVGEFGMNTPAYFAADDLRTTPAYLLGDMNGDGLVNNFDVSALELALTDAAGFAVAFPTVTNYALRGDINVDGSFNNFDVSAFESLLTAPPSAPVPEPSSLSLAAIGGLVFLVRQGCQRVRRAGQNRTRRNIGPLATGPARLYNSGSCSLNQHASTGRHTLAKATGVGFGIIGCGMISRFHAQAVKEIRGARIAACFDAVPASADRFAAAHGCRAYHDLDAMLADPAVQVVTIGTPSGAHLEPAVAAARAGKHVIVEKPLEITLGRCDKIIRECERNKVKLSAIFPSRFHASSVLMKRAVEAGRFGKLTLAEAYVKWFRSQAYYDSGAWRGTWELDGGGALMNQAIHNVDLLTWLMGPVAEIRAQVATLAHERIAVEDTAVATLQFANGALGVIEASTAVYPGYLKRLEVHGSEGSAAMEEEDVVIWDFSTKAAGDAKIKKQMAERLSTAGGASDPAAIGHHGHRHQFQDVLAAIREDRAPAIDGHEGRRSVEIILAIYKAAETGRAVTLPLAGDPVLKARASKAKAPPPKAGR